MNDNKILNQDEIVNKPYIEVFEEMIDSLFEIEFDDDEEDKKED